MLDWDKVTAFASRCRGLTAGGDNATASAPNGIRRKDAMGKWLAASGLNGFCGVAFGAWAAHGASDQIGAAATEWVKTGAQYQLWHAVALLTLACAPNVSAKVRDRVGPCFCFGALLFSGSLYVLAIAGWHWVVFVAPIGGLLMLLGWLLLLVLGVKEWWTHR
jgi:uncharacterized membrane protein YgdD (TMEM256/DUF423 family)